MTGKAPNRSPAVRHLCLPRRRDPRGDSFRLEFECQRTRTRIGTTTLLHPLKAVSSRQ